jgi:sigma-E factor negative regulatory protein RseA
MKEKLNEKLSALLDGELEPGQQEDLFKAISDNPELRVTWERYHLTRAVIRNELEGLVLSGLANRISDKISQEPVILAPRRSGVISGNIAKLAGGLAIAASVAAISIISLQPSDSPDRGQLSSLASKSVVENNEYIRAAGVTRWSKRQPGLESTLNMYLVEHSEVTPTASFRGMMSYGRVAGYDNEK